VEWPQCLSSRRPAKTIVPKVKCKFGSIINDGAQAYKGAIPSDRWKEPYMSKSELHHEMKDSVTFFGWEEDRSLLRAMGVQAVQDVSLIRHAYVRTNNQKQGIGSRLLSHLETPAQDPILIGTWADAARAVHFCEKHGSKLVDSGQKDLLLRRYWTVPARQVETSVALADRKWLDLHEAKSG
jgi:GNAT superfamily N-acetyltransferase